MTEAIIILMNMRGGCATVGKTVHTLFRVTSGLRANKSAADATNSHSVDADEKRVSK